jgi:hypothetical protein
MCATVDIKNNLTIRVSTRNALAVARMNKISMVLTNSASEGTPQINPM